MADAFFWLLTGKNSAGQADVTFRPRGKDGQLIHDVDVSVLALIKLDGQEHKLTRTYHENWGISRVGDKIFKGNSTKFTIDDVPKSDTAWKSWVEENILAKQFAMTSNPAYVPNLPWKEQRKLILEVAGNVTDEMIIKQNEGLKELPSILNGRSIEDLQTATKVQLKPIKQELQGLPVRIDQESKDLPDEKKLQEMIENEQTVLNGHEAQIKKFTGEIAALADDSRKLVIQSRIDATEAKLDALRLQHKEMISQVSAEYDKKLQQLYADKKETETNIVTIKAQRQQYVVKMANTKDQINELAKEWHKVNDDIFHGDVCPTCHRPYDPEQIEPLRKEFNEYKAESLKKIVESGTAAKLIYSQSKAKADEAEKQLIELQGSVGKYAEAENDLTTSRTLALSKVKPLEDMPGYFEARTSIDANKGLLGTGGVKVPEDLQMKLDQAKRFAAENRTTIAELQASKKRWQVIADLKKRREDLRVSADVLEHTLDLIKKFNMAKISKVEDGIRKAFPGLEFRLFEQNITNDDFQETCELMMDGKPYRDLSDGEKVAAGMIIVNALSKYFGVNNPKFIDNTESITIPINIQGQAIKMRVSADKELKFSEEE